MKPESLLGIALELIESFSRKGPLPADARAGRLFREKRFLGSHDRRFVGDAAYAWLRHFHRARPRWTARAAELGRTEWLAPGWATGRPALLLDTISLARDGLFPWSFDDTIAASRRLEPPVPLAEDHLALWADEAWSVGGAWPRDPAEKLAAELSLPPWLAGRLVAERGEPEARRLALSLLEPAPVDLRVSLRRSAREPARQEIEEQLGVAVSVTPLSPLGLRLAGRKSLGGLDAVRDGLVEVEEEGSQLVTLCLDVEPGMTVIDACAGAGGKTLLLADILFRTGAPPRESRLIACDVSAERLAELRRRASVAGVGDWIETIQIAPQGDLPGSLPPADLLLVDAPCSGLGTLRRSPDHKHRYGPAEILEFARVQRAILERLCPAVKVGGRIAYVTCSILAEENEAVAGGLSAGRPELEAASSAWAAGNLSGACRAGPFLRLDPLCSGTDGFFLAVWRRVR